MLMFVPCSVTEPTTGLWLPYTVMLEWQQLLRRIIIIIIIIIVIIIIFIIIIIIILGP